MTALSWPGGGIGRELLRLIRPRQARKPLAARFPQFEIGRGSYGDLIVPRYSGDARLRIGAFCSFAAGVQVLLGGEHRSDWATTYPFSEIDPRFAGHRGHPRSKGDVAIGNDVWFGREAMVLSGVTIGDGAVIAARALVAQDVPPYAVVGGVPARTIRMRFAPEIVDRLRALRWWDWPDERIARAMPLMLDRDIEAFLDAAEAGRV